MPPTVVDNAYRGMGLCQTTSKSNRQGREFSQQMLFVLYLVSYLNQINIGFSSLTMNDALAITTAQFRLAVGIFLPATFSSKYPSNLLRHKMGACVWIASLLITWGIVAALTGAVQNLPQFYGCRFFAREPL